MDPHLCIAYVRRISGAVSIADGPEIIRETASRSALGRGVSLIDISAAVHANEQKKENQRVL